MAAPAVATPASRIRSQTLWGNVGQTPTKPTLDGVTARTRHLRAGTTKKADTASRSPGGLARARCSKVIFASTAVVRGPEVLDNAPDEQTAIDRAIEECAAE